MSIKDAIDASNALSLRWTRDVEFQLGLTEKNELGSRDPLWNTYVGWLNDATSFQTSAQKLFRKGFTPELKPLSDEMDLQSGRMLRLVKVGVRAPGSSLLYNFLDALPKAIGDRAKEMLSPFEELIGELTKYAPYGLALVLVIVLVWAFNRKK